MRRRHERGGVQLRRLFGGRPVAPLLWLAVVVLLSQTLLPVPTFVARSASLLGPDSIGSVAPQLVNYLPALAEAPLATVATTTLDRVVAGSTPLPVDPTVELAVVVTFRLSNQSALQALLTNLSSPSSPGYHRFISAPEFDRRYSPLPAAYAAAVEYFRSFGVDSLAPLPDRVSLSFDASTSVAARAFHTTFGGFSRDGVEYVAPLRPLELPAPLAAAVLQVTGLSTYGPHLLRTASNPARSAPLGFAAGTPVVASTSAGYRAPVTIGGVQFEYGPDFQVAYDEQTLLDQYGFPSNASVATVLWSGTYQGSMSSPGCSSLALGQEVAPFDPADVYGFYNETVPVGEPHATVTAVPVNGAPLPGPNASCDGTGANFENTLDLEMAGSTAPGAHLYNVYGPSASYANLDAAFAEILSPSASLPPAVQAGLLNVSVISNSWGGTDVNDSSWYTSLEQAQARGISVLASTGDSANDPTSSKYFGSNVEYPSSMAFDTFGVTGVGGTTDTLDAGSLHLASEQVWNISAQDVAGGGPVGSTGGVSSVFSEPSWQLSTEANAVIGGAGRGVPDIAALANNTLVTLTIDGYQYRASNASLGGPFEYAWGTSVACPLVAGIVATIDRALQVEHNPALGFLDPQLYAIANAMYAPQPGPAPVGIGAFANANYTASLPTLPFHDVTTGRNYLYSALPGYDLVTGWGSLDAYNYTMYVLVLPGTPVPGHLSATRDDFNLSGLNVTSTFPGGGTNTAFNASLQQNFFLANSLGAPVYWVQNVVYISGSPGAWNFYFTGWVIFPFWGLYPRLAVYEYNVPAAAVYLPLPLELSLTTQLNNPGGLGATVTFSFGTSSAAALSLPVPGASYIIGSLNYNYSWQGVTYSNGPFAGSGVPGGLDPQFGLVGGPSYGIGDFQSPTAGNLSAWIQPTGLPGFVPAATQSYGLAGDQTGEQATDLEYIPVGPNSWRFTTQSGGTTQGIVAFEGSTYPALFQETGLPAGTGWGISVGGARETASGPSLLLYLPNGTYAAVATSFDPTWSAGPLPPFTIAGQGVNFSVAFHRLTYSVTFSESGLPSGINWSVTFHSVAGSVTTDGATDSILFSPEPNGTYPYTIAGIAGWAEGSVPYAGSVRVSGGALTVSVMYGRVVYGVTFRESGLAAGLTWSVAFDGHSEQLTTDGGTDSLAFPDAPNGTYPYTLFAPSGWTENTTSSAGNLRVSGAAVVIAVVYARSVYTVTFTEAGLPPGTNWSVTMGGVTRATVGTTITFVGPDGAYNYSVAAVGAYAAVPSSGTVTVQGANATVGIVFSAPAMFLGLPGVWGYVVVGAMVVVVLALIAAVLARRRRPPPPVDNPPPPSRPGPRP